MATDKFCLRWNDFESNISSAFRELRDDKDFFDVTLACDDEQIQAHKVIISACSPFFHNVLRRNPHQHPLLYLKGMKFTDLQSVLNFMYHGEVNVAQEELNSFLAVAEDLRVKGLTQNQPEREKKKSSITTNKPSPPVTKAVSETVDKDTKRSKLNPLSYATYALSQPTEDEEIQEVIPIKSEPNDVLSSNYIDKHTAPPAPVAHVSIHPVEDQTMTTYQEEEEYPQYEDDQQYQVTDHTLQMQDDEQGKGRDN
jgi:hypothetical protein